jgi:hypothetical protein
MNTQKLIQQIPSTLELKNGCKHSSNKTPSKVESMNKMLVPISFSPTPTYYRTTPKQPSHNVTIGHDKIDLSYGKEGTY